MIKNRFFKSTLGYFAELAIVSALDASNTAAMQATLAAFVTTGVAGTLWVGWEDTLAAVAAGDTALAANAKRKFFYAWKQSDGTLKRTIGIPANNFAYQSVAWNAGTAQVRVATFAGTYNVGQTLYVKIIETTGTHLPYPTYHYEALIGSGGINQAVTDIKNAINAEAAANSPVATATSSTNVLTVTAVDKIRNFKIVTKVFETTAYPDDLSAVTQTETKQVYPIGDVASVKELAVYANIYQGGLNYAPEGTNLADYGQIASNLDETGTTHYGFVLVTDIQTETGGVMEPAEKKKAYVLIAVKTADVATIVAL